MTTFYRCGIAEHEVREQPGRCLAPVADYVCGFELKPYEACPKQVFVDDGWPAGQCMRERGHTGLCDVYDGRPDGANR